jgi:uncharacterized protein DUF6714
MRQAEVIDRCEVDQYTKLEFDRIPLSEVTEDWTLVPDDELTLGVISHLDAEGLHYYLPALLLFTLDHYADDNALAMTDMAVIGTIMALAPSKEFRAWQHAKFESAFTPEQRIAVAAYVEALPRLLELNPEDAPAIERAFDEYWADILLASWEVDQTRSPKAGPRRTKASTRSQARRRSS